MSTKFEMQINPEFDDLFSFGSDTEKIEHKAQMISYRILSEVEKLCDEKKIKKKDLADMVGTSRSYITQLFRGTKQINTTIMARFEDALKMSFFIKAQLNEDSNEDFFSKQIPIDFFKSSKRFPVAGCVMYYFPSDEQQERTSEIVGKMEVEDKKLQKEIKNKLLQPAA